MVCKNCNWSWKIEPDDENPQLCHKCGFDSKLDEFDFNALNTWKQENLPFIEETTAYSLIRTFNEDVDTDDLVWHRDYEDRVVIVLSETDWKFQFDNQLPITLKEGSEIMIPKGSYHRVIKGNGDLVVEVLKTDFGSSDTYNVIVEGEKKKKKKDACYYKVKSRYDVWPSAYASGALVQCRKVGAKNWGKTDETSDTVEEKTDFSKEKDKGLHGWFSRKGGGGSKGWVDCNTCKKDPDTGTNKCKPCGRKEGESRSKYPACRPTPSACKTKGKGKSWGKKSEGVVINEQPTKNVFYHGTNTKINRFVDDFVGAKAAHDQNGPGIYFTSSKANAMTYGQYLYTVELDLKKTVSTQEGRNISYKEAEFLIKRAPDWKGTAQNWHENAMIGAKLAIKDFIAYNDSPFEQFLQIWIDFYRDNSVDFVRNMVRLGYDGAIIPGLNSMITDESNITHVVVYNPNTINYIESEHIRNENTIKENSVFSSIGDINQTYTNFINDKYDNLVEKITKSGGDFILGNKIDKRFETHGNPNECEQNVFNFIKKMETPDGSLPKIMDGDYIYHPVVGYVFEGESLFPVEHWWVYDSDRNKHIEVTPTQGQAKAYAGFIILGGADKIVKNKKWFDVSFLKLGVVNKLIQGGSLTENQRPEPLKNKKHPKSVSYLKSLLNLTSNNLAIKRLNGWIARAKGAEIVNLSDKENELLRLIKTGGITPNDFSRKN